MNQLEIYKPEQQQAFKTIRDLLKREPNPAIVKINTMAKGAKYLPIGEVETLLDDIFMGLWSTENFRWQVIANEIVGSLDLVVIHPATGRELRRTGAGAVMIQIQSGKPMVVENKITNTLTKDFPHLKAECLKNAAKSIGEALGRNLNRQVEDHQPLEYMIGQLNEDVAECVRLLETAKITDDARAKVLKRINKANPKELTKVIEYLRGKQ